MGSVVLAMDELFLERGEEGLTPRNERRDNPWQSRFGSRPMISSMAPPYLELTRPETLPSWNRPTPESIRESHGSLHTGRGLRRGIISHTVDGSRRTGERTGRLGGQESALALANRRWWGVIRAGHVDASALGLAVRLGLAGNEGVVRGRRWRTWARCVLNGAVTIDWEQPVGERGSPTGILQRLAREVSTRSIGGGQHRGEGPRSVWRDSDDSRWPGPGSLNLQRESWSAGPAG
jgi:hypothetical protein